MKELNNREIQLIKILTKTRDYLPVHVIAEKLNISTKTVYRDIDKIKEKRKDLKFERKQGKGIKLSYSSDYLDLLTTNAVLKYSVEERRIKILLKLLRNSNQYTSIDALSEKYFVSKSSIVNDINYINSNFLYNKNISIEKNRNGTKITGSEKEIRNLLVQVLKKYSFISEKEETPNYTSERINNATIKELSDRFGLNVLSKVEEIIKKHEKRLPYTIGDLYYTNLVVHILIAIERIKKGIYVDYSDRNIGSDLDYYREAINISNDLNLNFDIKFPENEIYYIYQYLVSTGVGELNSYNNTTLSQDIEDITKAFLKELSYEYYKNIDKNTSIYYVFKLHLRALVKRLKYNIKIKNPLVEKIKEDYFKLFEKVKLVSKKVLCNEISDDEIAYLTVYAHSLLERNFSKKNVILVCHSGFGTSQFLKKRIEGKLPKLNVIDVISSKELENYNLTNIEYIISTVKINNSFLRVINVSVILSDEDVKTIKKEIFGEI